MCFIICPNRFCNAIICIILLICFCIPIHVYFLKQLESSLKYTETTNSSIQYVLRAEKKNVLGSTVDQKDDNINVGIIHLSQTGDRKDVVCFLPLFFISIFVLLSCNLGPEYFFRKRIKVCKYQFINVEKECGCNYVYKKNR